MGDDRDGRSMRESWQPWIRSWEEEKAQIFQEKNNKTLGVTVCFLAIIRNNDQGKIGIVFLDKTKVLNLHLRDGHASIFFSSQEKKKI